MQPAGPRLLGASSGASKECLIGHKMSLERLRKRTDRLDVLTLDTAECDVIKTKIQFNKAKP